MMEKLKKQVEDWQAKIERIEKTITEAQDQKTEWKKKKEEFVMDAVVGEDRKANRKLEECNEHIRKIEDRRDDLLIAREKAEKELEEAENALYEAQQNAKREALLENVEEAEKLAAEVDRKGKEFFDVCERLMELERYGLRKRARELGITISGLNRCPPALLGWIFFKLGQVCKRWRSSTPPVLSQHREDNFTDIHGSVVRTGAELANG